VQRKFITNLALLLLLNLLIKPFWIFGIDRTVQNIVSPEDYGIYFALFNFSMLFNILLDVGITNYNSRNIAQHNQLLSKYFSGIVVFKLLLAVFYFAISFAVGYFAGYDSTRFYLLLFLTLNQFLISFIQYLRSNIAGLQLFALDSFLSILDKSLMIILCAILLWGNIIEFDFQLMHFVYAQTIAYATTLAIVFFIVLSKSDQFKFKLNRPFSFLILKQTYPYALLILTMTFYYRLDAVMIDMMLEDGEQQAAIYAQAYRLMDAANMIGVLFAGLLLPMFAHMIQVKKRLDSLVKLSFSLLFAPAIVLAIICFFFSKEIMDLLYNRNTAEAAQVLIVLMSCFVAIATTYIFGTLLTANGSIRLLNKIAIGGMLLNFILNFILIPHYQAVGSALASLITQFVVVIFQVFVVKNVFNFKINYSFLGSLLIYVILILGITKSIDLYLSNLSLQIFLSGFIAFILGILLRIIDIKNIYKVIIKQEE